jgi:threonylcarbamoyladenosine tRNA methylthiotransferase MtaB
MILKRMKRRHTKADKIGFCEAVRRYRPEAAFGADLIAGFPTESEAMFENSLKLVDDAGLSFLHVFPFSPRLGTPAERMPQLPRAQVKERAARLRARGAAALTARLQSLTGSRQMVLAERGSRGHTPCFAQVSLQGAPEPGTLLALTITGRTGDHLTGIAV